MLYRMSTGRFGSGKMCSLWRAYEDDGGVSRHGFWCLLVVSAVKKHSDGAIRVNVFHLGGGGGRGISTLDLAI